MTSWANLPGAQKWLITLPTSRPGGWSPCPPPWS